MNKEELNKISLKITPKQIEQIQKQMHEIMFGHQENNDSHNPVEWGEELMEYIFRGDRQGLMSRLSNGIRLKGSPGHFSDDVVKNIRYLCICVVSTVTFRMIDMKLMDIESACSLSDAIICEMDKCNTVDEIADTVYAGLLIFTDYVSVQPDRNYNYLCVQTKRYIHEHLHAAIKVSDISKALSCNESYLSRVFRQTEGVTIQKFIQKNKIEQCCGLLKYSNLTISEISAVFHFSSQSHFGSVFKKLKGTTPQEYRNKYQEHFYEK